jgi:tRNA dimethylallyltransferase
LIALIGPTASGKSDLAIDFALKYGYEILSLDSLSIYKEIDIASAKPSQNELQKVKHHGVNEIFPNEKFDVMKFIEIYQKIKDKKIIIVGGTSFYLKAMLTGISQMPKISEEIKKEALKYNWEFLNKIDKEYASKIKPQDSYRVSKAIEIYLSTNTIPSLYFKQNPPKPIIENCDIYEIAVDRTVLRERIKLRTAKMFQMGLIDEVAYLESKYRDRTLPALKAIGIKEVLDYFNGVYNRDTLKEKIITNTARLAKRQQTFNKTQFENKISLPLEELREKLLKDYIE